MDMRNDAEWITAFDWQAAGAEARDDGALSARLTRVLLARQPRRPASGTDTGEGRRFGRFVATMRRERGWTRPELAERARVDPVAVALLENGALDEEELTPEVVRRVVTAFGLPVRALPIPPYPLPGLDAVADIGGSRQASFGAWLAGMLGGLTEGMRSAGAWRGEALTLPVALPEQSIALPGGRMGTMYVMLEPAQLPTSDTADVHMRLVDDVGQPAVGVVAQVDLGGQVFRSRQTDETGVARIGEIPLGLLVAVEQVALPLRALPLVVTAGPAARRPILARPRGEGSRLVAASGVPGVTGAARVYEAPGVTVTITITAEENSRQRTLHGVVAALDPESVADAVVRLKRYGAPVGETMLDASGRLTFPSLDRGMYSLEVDMLRSEDTIIAQRIGI